MSKEEEQFRKEREEIEEHRRKKRAREEQEKEEDAKWRLQYPSITVNPQIFGDMVYGARFIPEGNKLLYQLKNLMGLNPLGKNVIKQDQMIRRFNDGTLIIAKSIDGMDYIEIYPKGGKLKPGCTITLNLPLVVPPMKWYPPGTETFTDGVLRAPDGTIEVEGKDYIKTYYTLSLESCPDCGLAFTLCKADTYDLYGSTCRPFIYKSEQDDGTLIYNYQGAMVPHYMGWTGVTPPIPPDPLKHTIYSFSGCQAEIIFGADEGGTYFIWKAYTEWSVNPYIVTFSRTGLGYLLMQGFVKYMGMNLCESNIGIIKVDCCEKPADERHVDLWWEFEGSPFLFYGDLKLSEVPSVIGSLNSAGTLGLFTYWWEKGGVFYVIPELRGGCLPFDWTLSGAGILTPVGEFRDKAQWIPNDAYYTNCSEPITISVKDRCGTTSTVTFESCCAAALPLSISYTTLAMSVNQQQYLYPVGGCAPYKWELGGGGGTIESDPSGQTALYTAPSTNAECANNPTVTVTDCCGNTASVQMAVNGWAGGDDALRYCESALVDCICYPTPPCGELFCCYHLSHLMKEVWNCSGTLKTYEYFDINPADGWNCRYDISTQCPGHDCLLESCVYGGYIDCSGQKCNTSKVIRSAAMKTGGCCPINPFTGLPY